MSYMKNKYIKPLILVVAFLILSLVTVSSYAYFSASVQGNDNAYDTVITSGEMALMLNDGEQVGLNNAIPGDSIVKEFSVKNTGTVETTYDVYFSELFNTFEDKNDLVYTLESSNGCTDGNEKVVPRKSSDDSKMVSSCLINSNQTHNYTLTITFKNDGTNQDDNKGKKFSSKISINEYGEYQSEGYLAIGPMFNSKIWKDLAGDKSNIKRIVNNDAAPTELDNYIIVNDTESSYRQDYPIYMWYKDGTVYMYSDNSVVYLNEDASNMFRELSNVQEIDLSFFDSSRVNNMGLMFAYDSKLASLDLSNFDTSNVIDMHQLFCGTNSLISLDISHLNTSKVTNMSQMFYNADSLISLDLSNFDTSSLTNMSAMFFDASSLEELIFGDKFNISKISNISGMFQSIPALKKIKFGNNFNINVNSISALFQPLNNLEEIEFGDNFITSSVKDMSYLFVGNSKLTKIINFNKIDTSNVENMAGMFMNCTNLSSIDLNGINTSKVTNMESMFMFCKSLTELDLSTFNMSNVSNAKTMFMEATSLRTIYTSGDWALGETALSGGMFNNCTSLVGGAGTTYDSSHDDILYARIDDPTNGKPGYFTLKTN